MQKITQFARLVALVGASALVTGCSSAGSTTTPGATRPAASAPASAPPSPSAASQPVVADWAQSATAGAAAVMNIVLRGGRPSGETCATQWNELPPQKQASLDRAGFDAGCNSASTPDTVTGHGPTATP
ncbi:hypothetical protein OG871_34970 [Kitasatospora sp. NBC_00374]|uniref:hypothetical protein n=1 Tax=Kitasatospora sp. NBC_00374 TaxID=2975964 RepID=UPI0030DEA3F3